MSDRPRELWLPQLEDANAAASEINSIIEDDAENQASIVQEKISLRMYIHTSLYLILSSIRLILSTCHGQNEVMAKIMIRFLILAQLLDAYLERL